MMANAQSVVPLGAESSDWHFKVVFVAEGFTSSTMPQFLAKASLIKSQILNLDPFSSNAQKMNFYTWSTVSTDNGISEEAYNGNPAVVKTTRWHTYLRSNRTIALPTVDRIDLDDQLGNLSGGNKVYVFLICNTDEWAGAGEFADYLPDTPNITDTGVTLASMHDTWCDAAEGLVLHEFCHTFGNLDDEYYGDPYSWPAYPGNPIPSGNDATYNWFVNNDPGFLQIPNRANIKDTNPGGWFQGGRYQTNGKYRSIENGLMRGMWYYNAAKGDYCYPLELGAYNEALIQTRINEEAKTFIGRPFIVSAGKSQPCDACSMPLSLPRTLYVAEDITVNAYPSVGLVAYSNVHCTIPYNGKGSWFKFEGSVTGVTKIMKIATDGTITNIADCDDLQCGPGGPQ